jgi:hypothetical protein
MRNYWAMNPDRLQRWLHERSPLAVRRVRQRDLVPLHDLPGHHAARVRHGKVIWWRFVSSEADALEAAGLQE